MPVTMTMTTSKVFSCSFLAWISLLLVACFQLVHIYNLEMNGILSASTGTKRFSRRAIPLAASSQPQKLKIPEEPSKGGKAAVIEVEIEAPKHASASTAIPPASSMQPLEESAPLPKFAWNTSNPAATCQVWPKQSIDRPTGLVVTLVLTPDDKLYVQTMRQLICNAIPSQLMHLLAPQQWDLLLVIAGDDYRKALSHKHLIQCLNLTRIEESDAAGASAENERTSRKVWHNIDGTNLTTVGYRWQDRISVFISEDYHLEWPHYIQRNQSILSRTISPPVCDAPKSYIHGTRWYTKEMLHLQILQRYHYFIKLDIDLFFHKTPQWDLLHDMQTRGSLFAHTAELPKWGGKSCTTGIVKAVQDFSAVATQQGGAPLRYCGHDEPLLKKDRDWYYTNFIIGRVDFWTQPLVQQFGTYLSEYQPGFFHHRWTDQIMWPQVLGLLVGLHYGYNNSIDPGVVVDYTELRCSVEKNCWTAPFYIKIYGKDSYNVCPNGGYFRHSKNSNLGWKNTSSLEAAGSSLQEAPLTATLWKSDTEYYAIQYKDECKERLAKKHKEYDDLHKKNGTEMKAVEDMIKHIPPGYKAKSFE